MLGDNLREDADTPSPVSEASVTAKSARSKFGQSSRLRLTQGATAFETISCDDFARIDPPASSHVISASFARRDEAFQPIFVVGCPRSGTTLLSVILDRHSEVAVPPETHFAASVMPAAFPESSDVSGGFEVLPVHAVSDLFHQTPLKDLGLDPAAIIMRLRGCPATPATLLRSVLEEYASQRKKPKVAEKTPGHELYLDQLLTWFPRARFVWIVRDGRAVVQSQRRMHWIHQPLWQLSMHWRRSAIQTLRFEAAHPGKIFRIQYEALLRDPHRALAPLHRFLRIRLEPQQLRPNGPTGVIPDYENGWKIKANQPIDVRRSDAWRTETTKWQLLLMNCLMGRYLREFGYSDTSVRQFGIHAVALCALADVALTVLFVPRIYGIVRDAYRAFRRPGQMARRLGRSIHWSLSLAAVEIMNAVNRSGTAVVL